MHYVKILLFVFLTSSLFGAVDFPQVYNVFEKTKKEDRIYKIRLSNDKKRLLVMRHNSISLMDAKSFKVLKKITFDGSAWDCAFAEKGFVLLTHHDFSYYDDTGTQRLYYVERRDGGQIDKMDMDKNGYIVNLIKDTGRTIPTKYGGRQEKGLVILNLRTYEYKETVYKVSDYRDDIRNNILKVSTGNDTYDYINILTGKRVSYFPDDNITPNGKQVVDMEELSLKDTVNNKVIQTYVKPAKYLRFGCMDPSGKRFAILTEKEPVHVYNLNKPEPIFSLPNNLNAYKKQSCLLYDDTLILWGDSMQTYSFKEIEKINNAVKSPLKVMPILGSCTDASHSVSAWVDAMYGWDVQNGKMLWHTSGPKSDGNFWEEIKYFIKMQSDSKSAVIQPIGDFEKFKVNLDNGSYAELGTKKDENHTKDSVVCDLGRGELSLRKDFRFIHRGVSFYALSRGEWLVISNEDGYFNASSKDALTFLHKDYKALNDEDIKKWYRPDIIEAKLSNTEILEQAEIKTNYTLPERSELKNHYLKSILQGIKTGDNYVRLLSLTANIEIEQIDEVFDAIPNDEEAYFYFYRALSEKRFRPRQLELFNFLNKRVENISAHSNEAPALLKYLRTDLESFQAKDAEFEKSRRALIERLLRKYKAN